MSVKVTLTIPHVLFLPFHFAINFTLCRILQVGPTYGRKMMTDYLRQKLGTAVGQNRVGAVLSKAHPGNHRKRQNKSERKTNPIPYRADYFGLSYTLIKMKNWLQLTDTVALWLQLVHHQLKTILYFMTKFTGKV